jgi:hypothetical protein
MAALFAPTPILVLGIVRLESDTKGQLVANPPARRHNSSTLTFDETQKWSVLTSHPLAAICILIHPNR